MFLSRRHLVDCDFKQSSGELLDCFGGLFCRFSLFGLRKEGCGDLGLGIESRTRSTSCTFVGVEISARPGCI